MRGITVNGLAKAQEKFEINPTILVKIEWTSGIKWYADKDLTLGTIVAAGRISSFSGITSEKKQDNVGSVSSVQITLDDHDGLVKALFDTNGIEYLKASVHLHFEGLAEADLSLLFEGRIAGPIEWSEGRRELSFDIETKSRDLETSYAVEALPSDDLWAPINESIQNLNPDAVGKAWPLCFGNPVLVPALLLKTAGRGYLKYPFRGPRNPLQLPTIDPYWDDIHFYLRDGDGQNFPQDELIDLIIEGWVFRGVLHHDKFTVATPNVPKYEDVLFADRDPNDPDNALANVAWLVTPISIINCFCLYKDEFGDEQYFRVLRQESYVDRDTVTQRHKVQFDTPCILPETGAYRFFSITNKIAEVAVHGREGWKVVWETTFSGTPGSAGHGLGDFGPIGTVPNPSAKRIRQTSSVLTHVPWRFNAETEVRLWSPHREDVWIANAIESTDVVAVHAERTNREGVKLLLPLHASMYSVSQPTMSIENADGTTTVMNPTLITVDPPLREYDGQKWGEQIYVTLHSSIGPNTSDIIKWLLETYTTIPVDAASFADVATKIDFYPSSFPRFQRENALSLAETIAWLARCGLRMDQGEVELVYLSEEPDAVVALSEAEVALKSMLLGTTRTEDIWTRLTATYKLAHYPHRRFDRTYVFTQNIDRYGLRRKDIDFFIYNIPSLVEKSAQFLGRRFANSWRTMKARAFLDALPLEVHDGLDLEFDSLLGIASIRAVVNQVSIDGGLKTVSVDAVLPSLAGTTVVSDLFWMDDSADVDPGDPTDKYLPAAIDLRYSNDESRFQALQGIGADGNVAPGRTTDYAPPVSGTPSADPVNLDNIDVPTGGVIGPGGAITVGGVQVNQVFQVDKYENGRNQPKTGTVYATPLDPDNPPSVPANVGVAQINGKNYIISGASGTSAQTYSAKIKLVISPTVYQVDLFANGYEEAATNTVTAQLIDLNSQPFAVDAQVEVFLQHSALLHTDKYYIGTCKPWTPNTNPPTFWARITVNHGDGTYDVKATVSGFGSGFIPGAPTLTAQESIKSALAIVGLDIECETIGIGYGFSFPAGDGS